MPNLELNKSHVYIFLLCTLKNTWHVRFLKCLGVSYYIFSLLAIDSTETISTFTHRNKYGKTEWLHRGYNIFSFSASWKNVVNMLGKKLCLTQFLKTLLNNIFLTAYLAHTNLKTSFLSCKFSKSCSKSNKINAVKFDWVLGDIKK